MKSIRDLLTIPNMTLKAGELEAFQRQREAEERAMVERILQENAVASQAKLQRIFDENSLIPKALRSASFENYEPTNENLANAKKIAVQYAMGFDLEDSRNLILIGPCGIGKSHLAKAIATSLTERGITSIFVSAPRLLTKIKSTYDKENEHSELKVLDAMEKVDCLIIDDIGTEDDKSWAVRKLFEIIDSRAGKHTVYTTNLSSKEMQKKMQGRNFSRMMQDIELLLMDGKDYRLRGLRRAGE